MIMLPDHCGHQSVSQTRFQNEPNGITLDLRNICNFIILQSSSQKRNNFGAFQYFEKIHEIRNPPFQSGKTLLANFLADATENPSEEEYRPTHVVRILEFESVSSNILYILLSQIQVSLNLKFMGSHKKIIKSYNS